MTQTLLDLDPLALSPIDRIGFDTGFDHAHHGLVPPQVQAQPQSAVAQGWLAGKAVYGRRTAQTQHSTRLWLALRLQAWSEGAGFDSQHLTRAQVAQLQVARCPIRRTPLGGAPGHPDAAVIERLDAEQAYVEGNLVMLSREASSLRRGLSALQARRLARRCEAEGNAVDGLDAGGWWRIAGLRSLRSALPFHEAAAMPLALWPPAQTRPVTAAQRLQLLVTAQFAAPGFSARTRLLAAVLPAHSLRLDFNLFIAALAPRVLEAVDTPAVHAVENAWLHERVQRRWQHFLLGLGEAGCASLLERAGRIPQLHPGGSAQWRPAEPAGARPRTAAERALARAQLTA